MLAERDRAFALRVSSLRRGVDDVERLSPRVPVCRLEVALALLVLVPPATQEQLHEVLDCSAVQA